MMIRFTRMDRSKALSGLSMTRSSPRNSRRYRRTSGTAVDSGDPRLTRRTAGLGMGFCGRKSPRFFAWRGKASGNLPKPATETDLGDQVMDVFRRDAVRDHRAGGVGREV